MAIVNSYVKNYYSSLSTTDFALLMNCLQTILSNNNGNLDWDSFEKLTCLALQNSSSVMSKNEENDNILISLWNSCIRYFTFSPVFLSFLRSLFYFWLFWPETVWVNKITTIDVCLFLTLLSFGELITFFCKGKSACLAKECVTLPEAVSF